MGFLAMTSEEIERLKQALKEAKAHVYRQQYVGKHEQDRLDASKWLERYGELL
jgi:hypothetical protein